MVFLGVIGTLWKVPCLHFHFALTFDHPDITSPYSIFDFHILAKHTLRASTMPPKGSKHVGYKWSPEAERMFLLTAMKRGDFQANRVFYTEVAQNIGGGVTVEAVRYYLLTTSISLDEHDIVIACPTNRLSPFILTSLFTISYFSESVLTTSPTPLVRGFTN